MPIQVETPSGQQLRISLGDQQATVVEVGGALREYRVQGRPVLDGYPVEAMCSGARGQLLVPWPNRIQDGAYRFDGQELQLALTEPEKRNAIHGLLRWTNWRVMKHEESAVALSQRLHPTPGYPFTLDVAVEYRLSDEGLRVELSARNLSSRDCPFGAGAHPYLTAGTPTVDEAVLQAPGRLWMPTDERGIPVRTQTVEGGPFDFRRPRSLKGVQLDYAFTGLQRDADGRAWVTLTSSEGPGAASLWMDPGFPYVELFTGDTLKQPSEQRRGLGVEPMTCAPNAFQTGEGLIRLAPGQAFRGAFGICSRAP